VTEARPGPRRPQLSPFPSEWGLPPLDRDKRAAWALERIEEGRAARARGEQVAWLHHPTPEEVSLHLLTHIESPAIAAARRQEILAIQQRIGRLLDLEATRREP
jgi:hypothetical protein